MKDLKKKNFSININYHLKTMKTADFFFNLAAHTHQHENEVDT